MITREERIGKDGNMTLKVWELISIILSALVVGMFCGPWAALTRSMNTFGPEVYLAIGHRLVKNVAPVMTVLMPVALLSILPVLFISYRARPRTFYLASTGFALFLIALIVTLLVEAPISRRVKVWTMGTLPDNWQQLRDRWGTFHIVRVVASVAGLGLLVGGAIF
jgi:uncharacterized membrane protein